MLNLEPLDPSIALGAFDLDCHFESLALLP
jgi:hypothetical protein